MVRTCQMEYNPNVNMWWEHKPNVNMWWEHKPNVNMWWEHKPNVNMWWELVNGNTNQMLTCGEKLSMETQTKC